jgi:HSP20 family molecular chaperone IbpA
MAGHIGQRSVHETMALLDLDVRENADAIVVEVDLPGVDWTSHSAMDCSPLRGEKKQDDEKKQDEKRRSRITT